MHIVLVSIKVKLENIQEFKEASIENARASLNEPGIARFDFIQQSDDPTRFMLIEVYRTSTDPVKHKETAHYDKWRQTVEPYLSEPRQRVVYENVFPADADW